MAIKAPKKLIEVALPLDDINEAAAREKSIRHGHPSTLHLWWARRPLAAARAVLFAQLVNDPGGERGWYTGKTKEQAEVEREKLFGIIRDLVKWENTNKPEVLERAREAIRQSWRETCAMNEGKPGFDPEVLPAFHDPFAGGGAIPLEAQRLGLESYASDLNPVAVLINKAMIEIPPKFAGRAPVGPLPEGEQQKFGEVWSGASGLAEDVRRYGAWMREEAFKRIGHLYPKVDLKTGLPVRHGEEQPGQETATVIAWIWARTVKSPNPAFSHVDVPLVSSFLLATKPGKESWIEPVVEGDGYRFEIRNAVEHGKPPAQAQAGTKASGRGANFLCILSGTPIDGNYIKAEGQAGRMGARLMAVVAESSRGRIYLSPTTEMERIALSAAPSWKPSGEVPARLTGGTCYGYGLTTWGDLFSSRQLAALTTFSEMIPLVQEKARTDALVADWGTDETSLSGGGIGPTAYGEAVAVYLAFAVDKMSEALSTICTWSSAPKNELVVSTFRRQALPMTWDYAEANPFADSSGSALKVVEAISRVIATAVWPGQVGSAYQHNAVSFAGEGRVVSTDPPYYDNIGYADLSDFLYVWMRRSLRAFFPSLFATLAVPKSEELVATPYRHESKEAAETFFMEGMTQAMQRIADQSHRAFPVSIYYAFKQSESSDNHTANTGWETFLEAVLRSGFAITGTWPMRTEREGRSIGVGTNALASSIVLVCRKRDADAPTISRREFIRELKEVLPQALADMTGGSQGRSPVAAVDLAQAIIGPGMAVFSKYAAVLEADGTPMSVHTALTLINTYLPGDPDDFDADTRFCLSWFEENGWAPGQFGQADVLARAKGTAVDHVADAGVLYSARGDVRLLKGAELAAGWMPDKDANTPVWEATHQLIRALQSGGESEAGALLARMPDRTEKIRQLAYRLYTLCERKGWAEEARAYNELIDAWAGIDQVAQEIGRSGEQTTLF